MVHAVTGEESITRTGLSGAKGSDLFTEMFPPHSTANPASILAQLSPESLQRFHNRNILVIDDDHSFGELTKQRLSQLYSGKVDFISSPLEALNLIKNRADTKYDALVLDVLMPEMLGTSLIKELGENCPAVLLHTASLSNDEFANLSDEFGEYSLNTVEQLLADHGARLDRADLPHAPILRHHKANPLLQLVRKLNHAMLLHDEDFGTFSEFVKAYEPETIPKTPSEYSLHTFCSRVNEYTIRLEDLIEQHIPLHDECNMDWGWFYQWYR